jgi:hypothetical protein
MYAAITSKLGVHVVTTTHDTQRAAEIACRRSIRSGAADSAAVWSATEQIAIFGSGR